ncbi:hypothetical protein [Azohydromonas lata]|uniref:DNA-binding protein n=1 Tax=Azohydromonas lata TaxID=45677 RepID=A0ABU5IG17_9BURK|nr:hypothetical protein [Azohydromonas lata]MDZ5457898.1 hypothetical protein [Azohydromonas lata]
MDDRNNNTLSPDPEEWAEVPDPDFGADDYFALPDSGVGYYSLEDAALLAALDMWNAGQVLDVPVGEGWPEGDGPRVRKGIEPLQRQLLDALARSVESGLLEAVVRRRTLPDSRPVPGHTFVRLADLEDWLEVHGHMRGPVIEAAAAVFVDNPWQVACAVARDRAELRHPAAPTQPQQHGDNAATLDEVTRLKRELQEARLHVLHLQRQGERRNGAGRRRDDLGARERATLLKLVIGMAIDAYRFDPTAARTTVPKEVAEAFALLPCADDIAVTDDTVRKYLKEAAETVLAKKRS